MMVVIPGLKVEIGQGAVLSAELGPALLIHMRSRNGLQGELHCPCRALLGVQRCPRPELEKVLPPQEALGVEMGLAAAQEGVFPHQGVLQAEAVLSAEMEKVPSP